MKIICDNCGREIGKLETAHVWNNHDVCAECHKRVSPKSLVNGKQLALILSCFLGTLIIGACIFAFSYFYWAHNRTNAPEVIFSSTKMLPQDPETVIALLKNSLKQNPPPQYERWWIGSQPDLVTKIPHYVATDDGHVIDEAEYHTLSRGALAAKMEIYSPEGNLPVEDVFSRWKSRLNSVIDEEEINVAKAALEDARAKGLTSYADSSKQNDYAPASEKFGKTFETRVTHYSRQHVSIELLWINMRSFNKPMSTTSSNTLNHESK